MFEVRIHGRGGQGVVTAAEMLSIAAFEEGHHAQAFPSFGSERTGAPVVAFCRIADKEIRLREPIMQPDALIIQDPTLLHQIDVFAGLKKNGFILINTTNTFEELGLSDFVRDFPADRLCTLAATAPVMLLGGLVAGLVGPGPGLTLVHAVAGAAFLLFWIAGLRALTLQREPA